MYGKPTMTCFKYQVYLYDSEAITFLVKNTKPMRKIKGKTFTVDEPSHVKHFYLKHVFKIWLRSFSVCFFKIFFVYHKSSCQLRSANQDTFLNRDKDGV